MNTCNTWNSKNNNSSKIIKNTNEYILMCKKSIINISLLKIKKTIDMVCNFVYILHIH